MLKNVIYYFSGTGNSLRVARKIATSLGEATLVSMRVDPKDYSAADAEKVGFVFPVYYWTLPYPVRRFIEGLKINPKAYVFGVAVPGIIQGRATLDLSLLLKEKGISLAYANFAKYVANYVAMYPPFPNPKRRIPKAEKEVDVIASEIKEGKLRQAHVAFLSKITYPVLMKNAYRRWHVPALDKHFRISSQCISCGLCAKVCPCHNIVMKEGKPVFLHQCSQCMACLAHCPKEAINFLCFTKHRKKYRNPFVSAADLISNGEDIH